MTVMRADERAEILRREQANTDWSTAEVVRERRPVKVVYSVRFPADMSVRLAAAADARGLNPSELVRELVAAGLTSMEADKPLTVMPGELLRMLAAASVPQSRAA